MACRCQIINFDCLHPTDMIIDVLVAISAGPATLSVVKSFLVPATGLPLSLKWYGRLTPLCRSVTIWSPWHCFYCLANDVTCTTSDRLDRQMFDWHSLLKYKYAYAYSPQPMNEQWLMGQLAMTGVKVIDSILWIQYRYNSEMQHKSAVNLAIFFSNLCGDFFTFDCNLH